ncbi:MAG: 4Fe-4S dicluster domain-containing protein [Gemmatimonadales bacterium]|nr:4Fe-4S dicluster domain-containing protein [Gemmatimonadales bacterium]MBP6570017.1 4Fe-4S dicluster domain-containing protein [Gemmatimonadales bacterium]MBP7620953.1 4Fe-4S dicluster domain-containing protein [Gemmatimonadales bacterium]
MADEQGTTGVDRRQFLKVLGVTGAGTAALSGCSTDRVAKLVPYLVQSEQQVPGVATWYASTCTECAAGCGLHVKTREARPIKLEGNPEHPVNAGTLCSRGQAGLQALYNPDRLGAPMARNAAGGFDEITWDDAIARLAAKVAAAPGKVAVLNGYGPSTFTGLVRDWVAAIGGQVVQWEPFAREAERKANEQSFGRTDLPSYQFGAAKHILSFGADFLETWGPVVEQQRGFATSHGMHDGTMSKHVFVGPRMSLTGANADEYVQVAPGQETLVALGIAHLVAEKRGHPQAGSLSSYTPAMVAKETGVTEAQLTAIADAFAAAQPSLAVAGGIAAQHRGAIDLCAAVNTLNLVAGNLGKTVVFGAEPATNDGYAGITGLFDAIDKGQVGVLLVHEANPLYALPKSGKFTERFAKAGFKVSTAQVLDETAAACDLIIPNLHALERWDDLRPRAGVTGLLQPVTEPVFAAKHTGDVLLAVAKKVAGPMAAFTAPNFETYLKSAWAPTLVGDADDAWRTALGNGGVYAAAPATAQPTTLGTGAPAWKAPTFDGDGAYTLLPYASSMYYDGRGANKPWLLENPDPMTKITWQSWVEVHPDTAKAIDVREGEILELTSPHGSVRAQVYVFPGVHPNVLAMPLGLGHTEYGRYAKGRGANPLDLLGAADGQGFLPYVATKVSVKTTGDYRKVSKTEGNPRQLGRGIIEAMPLAYAAKGMTPKEAYSAAGHAEHEVNTPKETEAIDGWYEAQKERWKLGNYADDATPKWGMAVDLSRCTGCSACVTACYAENNIPTVGEEQIFKGREMSWMRIERYWEGGTDGEKLEARFAPVMCQHCDNAPCEPVCPVYAAYHTPDGLNGQVYNRCVGTRYCSNNCPFKVRYFNWLKYNETAWPAPLNLQLNPEVTTRARGVMEKCTFCVQRIRDKQNIARLEDRTVRDGEILPACVQGCPSGALTFGNVKDPEAAVVKAKRDPRGYTMLEETNVRPVVTYLAKVLHQEPVAHAPAAAGEGH